jgi:hypothetical protein
MPTVLLAAAVLLLLAGALISWVLEVGNDADRRMLASRPPDDV